jgi:short-subunit dehydrogenase
LISLVYGLAPYSITKYGVEAFSDALRREMAPWGVTVCILEPQGFKTPLWSAITGKKLTSLWNGINEEMKEEYGEKYLTNCKSLHLKPMFSLNNAINIFISGPHSLALVTPPQPPPHHVDLQLQPCLKLISHCIIKTIRDLY